MLRCCTKCKQVKDASLFGRSRNHPDGLNCWCKACVNKSGAAWKEANKERVLAVARASHHANAERNIARMKAWREANPDKQSEYYQKTKAEYAARVALYRASKAKRTPLWADAAAIAKVYADAEDFRALGLEVHVDHIVPLRGKRVSGLHVANNLQILLADDNKAKGNRFPSAEQ